MKEAAPKHPSQACLQQRRGAPDHSRSSTSPACWGPWSAARRAARRRRSLVRGRKGEEGRWGRETERSHCSRQHEHECQTGRAACCAYQHGYISVGELQAWVREPPGQPIHAHSSQESTFSRLPTRAALGTAAAPSLGERRRESAAGLESEEAAEGLAAVAGGESESIRRELRVDATVVGRAPRRESPQSSSRHGLGSK